MDTNFGAADVCFVEGHQLAMLEADCDSLSTTCLQRHPTLLPSRHGCHLQSTSITKRCKGHLVAAFTFNCCLRVSMALQAAAAARSAQERCEALAAARLAELLSLRERLADTNKVCVLLPHATYMMCRLCRPGWIRFYTQLTCLCYLISDQLLHYGARLSIV